MRVPDYNLCVGSPVALEIAGRNAARYTRLLPSTTGGYFHWGDCGRLMCPCRKCRHLSDRDQALLLNNALLGAVRQVGPRATLAHLAYAKTLPAPAQVRPREGIFFQKFAAMERRRLPC